MFAVVLFAVSIKGDLHDVFLDKYSFWLWFLLLISIYLIPFQMESVMNILQTELNARGQLQCEGQAGSRFYCTSWFYVCRLLCLAHHGPKNRRSLKLAYNGAFICAMREKTVAWELMQLSTDFQLVLWESRMEGLVVVWGEEATLKWDWIYGVKTCSIIWNAFYWRGEI